VHRDRELLERLEGELSRLGPLPWAAAAMAGGDSAVAPPPGAQPPAVVARALERWLAPECSLRDLAADDGGGGGGGGGGGAGDCCCCRGAGTRTDYLHGKKRPQVSWMVTELLAMVARARDAGRPIGRIADIGGGRGDLALCVAQAMPRVQVTVIDTNIKSLDASCVLACAAASDVALVGLHACGGLTDAILGLAVGAKDQMSVCSPSMPTRPFLVVPCCFNKHSHLVVSGCNWAHRYNTVDKAGICRLAESKDRNTSLRAMTVINTLRLSSVKRAVAYRTHPLELRMLQFSEDFSQRNLALQGC
jgi:hypothetical protein